jgi:sulfatase maturation enzyme AslB (radical SAM superfamily)
MEESGLAAFRRQERSALAELAEVLATGRLDLAEAVDRVRGGIDINGWSEQELRDLVAFRRTWLDSALGQIDLLGDDRDVPFAKHQALAGAETWLGRHPQAQAWLDHGAERHGWAPDPYGVNLQLTSRCNLKCVHCFQEVRTEDGAFSRVREYPDTLSSGDFLELFRKSRLLKACGICFSGGETYVREDVQEIFRGIARQGIRFDIGTNGTMPRRLQESLDDPEIGPQVDHVFFSIDGFGEVHERIRGKGTFAPLLRSMEIALTRGKAVGRAVVAQDGNLEILKELCTYVDNILILPRMRSAAFWQPRRRLLWAAARKHNQTHYFHALDGLATGMGCVAGVAKCNITPDGTV